MKDTKTPKHTNRLARETSPYLLQHQHNPVDWYPWGDEAFERARREDRPIFLSVGYSTCYWCHVMERQSFENDAVAAVMNEKFVNIKVDREERPDVDQLYMTAVQVLTRHGGWPMSVWLTPDLRPFYGGTYFPPTDAHGRPGFVTVLKGLDDAYRNKRPDVEQTANQLKGILEQIAEPAAPERPVRIDEECVRRLVDRSVSDYDPTFGGFGSAPKFPRETVLELLLSYTASLTGDVNADVREVRDRKQRILKMLTHTLDAMAAGGIRDQLGGGFHRYSTDARWLVPHFEIMLYDNALLAWCYVEAYRQTENRAYAEVARGIFDFVLREMTAPNGSFYTAFDAEVDGQEGLNYLWTPQQVEEVLAADDAKAFNRVYGLDRGFNFADPHHGTVQPDKNILYVAMPMESEAMNARLAGMRQKLYAARRQRKQPLLDTKVITSWNALMIRAFAYGGQVLQDQRYLDAARHAASFLITHHRTEEGALLRTSRDGKAKYAGFLDDYAFTVQALLAMHDAGVSGNWREGAEALSMVMRRKFHDDDRGGFYFTEQGARDLIVRQKVASDSPLPSGNAVAAMTELDLGHADVAQRTLAVFAGQLEQNGEGMSSMVQAALAYVRREDGFVVAPAPDDAAASPPASPEQVAAGVVAVRTSWASRTELHIHLDVLEGFHINANKAAKGLIPTRVAVAEPGGDAPAVASVEYPPGEERRFAFADEPLRVYEGPTTISVRLKDRAGEAPLRLSVTYQACDDNACLPPVTKRVEVPTP